MTKNFHVMFDTETLDVRPSGVVLSIGAVEFNPCEAPGVLGRRLHIGLDADEQLRRGRTVSANTICWWLLQDALPRSRIVKNMGLAISLISGLRAFSSFIRDVTKGKFAHTRLWCNGADFDFALLKSLFDAADMEPPFPYNCARDMRTYRELMIPEDYDQGAIAHDALADAEAQARAIQRLYARVPALTVGA